MEHCTESPAFRLGKGGQEHINVYIYLCLREGTRADTQESKKSAYSGVVAGMRPPQ